MTLTEWLRERAATTAKAAKEWQDQECQPQADCQSARSNAFLEVLDFISRNPQPTIRLINAQEITGLPALPEDVSIMGGVPVQHAGF